MVNSVIIGKVSAYTHQLAEKLYVWSEKKLPEVTENWWDDLVYNNLSDMQRAEVDKEDIHTVRGLDIASLMGVLIKSWFVIAGDTNLNSNDRKNLKEMRKIRNDWAHITDDKITKEKVINDMKVIVSLMEAFGATLVETSPMEMFVHDIENDVELKDEYIIRTTQQSIIATKNSSNSINDTISVGSLVALRADESVVGPVTKINNDIYSVWLDNTEKTFYAEQIKLFRVEAKNLQQTISKVRSALTAYQINNPSSTQLYSFNSARIDFVPYQFRPALKMMKADTPRILIADDVGVGKTIEAGLIIKEMEARTSVDSILII